MREGMIPRKDPIPALLKFTVEWVPDLSPEHRIEPSLIPKFIPPPLRAMYEVTGNWPVPYPEQWRAPNWERGLFGSQDKLLPMDRLKPKDGRVTFLQENQGVWTCETLIDGEDPPVYSDSMAYESGSKEMQEVCGSLSHFLTTYCLQELVFGSKHLFCVDSKVEKPEELVRQDLRPVWEKGVYVNREPSHSFYICNERVMVMNTWGDYWIAYEDEACAELVDVSEHKIRRIH
jgi:hypothetical protein